MLNQYFVKNTEPLFNQVFFSLKNSPIFFCLFVFFKSSFFYNGSVFVFAAMTDPATPNCSPHVHIFNWESFPTFRTPMPKSTILPPQLRDSLLTIYMEQSAQDKWALFSRDVAEKILQHFRLLMSVFWVHTVNLSRPPIKIINQSLIFSRTVALSSFYLLVTFNSHGWLNAN